MTNICRLCSILAIVAIGCGGSEKATPDTAATSTPPTSGQRLGTAGSTQLYWGDTHLHTSASGDAYANRNTTVDADTSYRFAKGLPVISGLSRARVQIGTPLDFLAVTDHAEYAGLFAALFGGDKEVAATKDGARYIEMIKTGKGTQVFFELAKTVNEGKPNKELFTDKLRASWWSRSVAAAERHNDPGKFTALIGWEWSSLPNGANLHRVVFMPQGGDVAKKFIPYSAFESDKPEDLWAWLEKTSTETGAEFVAIPHNSNISAGLMFMENDSYGRPITANYARTRMRWEPAVEITQIKGDSETHPVLSPDDEFADFETYSHLIKMTEGGGSQADPTPADYVRSALKRGLEIDKRVGVNPYKFGLIGATDSHSGLSSAEENNFMGKFSLDSTPESKDTEMVPGVVGWDVSASGLAAVWATENTRAGIVDAFRRKEVYGTSGPRIGVRVFGGFEFDSTDANARDIAAVGYKKGVPMGGDLTKAPDGKSPSFLIRAVKDPKDANLDRVQVVKGWLGADGESKEKIYNVSWSGDRKLDASGKLSAVGNTVDVKTAAYDNSIGSAELTTVWSDPDFDPALRAFYYVRVLQIPTPRNSLYDSVALQKDPPAGKPTSIQERAYTTPIWYTP